MSKFQRIATGFYQNCEWTIQKSSRVNQITGRREASFWFAYRTGTLTDSIWRDANSAPFLTLAEAKKFVEAN